MKMILITCLFASIGAMALPSFPATKDGIAKRELARVLLSEPVALPKQGKAGCQFAEAKTAAELVIVLLGNLSASEPSRPKQLAVTCADAKNNRLACSISVRLEVDQKTDPY